MCLMHKKVKLTALNKERQVLFFLVRHRSRSGEGAYGEEGWDWREEKGAQDMNYFLKSCVVMMKNKQQEF